MYIQQRMINEMKSLKVVKSKGENLLTVNMMLKDQDIELFSSWNLQQTDKCSDKQMNRQTDEQTFVILESLLRIRMLTSQCLFEYFGWIWEFSKAKTFVFYEFWIEMQSYQLLALMVFQNVFPHLSFLVPNSLSLSLYKLPANVFMLTLTWLRNKLVHCVESVLGKYLERTSIKFNVL